MPSPIRPSFPCPHTHLISSHLTSPIPLSPPPSAPSLALAVVTMCCIIRCRLHSIFTSTRHLYPYTMIYPYPPRALSAAPTRAATPTPIPPQICFGRAEADRQEARSAMSCALVDTDSERAARDVGSARDRRSAGTRGCCDGRGSTSGRCPRRV
ncbi:hypothetical protein BD413DRAFT_547507, partial [Trametes elegans]